MRANKVRSAKNEMIRCRSCSPQRNGKKRDHFRTFLNLRYWRINITICGLVIYYRAAQVLCFGEMATLGDEKLLGGPKERDKQVCAGIDDEQRSSEPEFYEGWRIA